MFPAIHVEVRASELWLWLSVWELVPEAQHWLLTAFIWGASIISRSLWSQIDSWSPEADASHVQLLSQPFPQAFYLVFFKKKNTKKNHWIVINIFSF